jgi:hypothetical protein
MNKTENEACKEAIRCGWEPIKLGAGERVGLPDRMFVGPGRRLFFVEFKKPGEPLRGAQKNTIRRFADLGWTVHVIDNLPDFSLIFNEYRKYGK